MFKSAQSGFTLAELLIALAILGVIATFTIPKILNSTQAGQNTAIFKEAASMVSGGFQNYQLTNAIATTTTSANMTPALNYVRVDTATTYTNTGTGNGITCAAATPCLVLHNGAILTYTAAQSFTTVGTGSNYITFWIDPDGTSGAIPTAINLYDNGRLVDGGNTTTGTAGTGGTAAITPTKVDTSYAKWN